MPNTPTTARTPAPIRTPAPKSAARVLELPCVRCGTSCCAVELAALDRHPMVKSALSILALRLGGAPADPLGTVSPAEVAGVLQVAHLPGTCPR